MDARPEASHLEQARSPRACSLCEGTGLVEDLSACGDPEHCQGWAPCPNGCPEAGP